MPEIVIAAEDPQDTTVTPSAAAPTTNHGRTTEVRVTDTGEDPKETPAEKPKLLAGKFTDQAALEKAYLELQSKLGAPKEAPKATAEQPKAPAGVPQITPQEAPKATAETPKLDFDAFASEYAEKGELSAESRAAIEKSGVPQKVVDSYIAGQQAIAQQIASTLAAPFGGEEGLKTAMQWAGANMDKVEVETLNEMLRSGQVGQAKVAARLLHSAYTEANGREGALVRGGEEVRAAGVKPFASQEEMVRAFSDRRYIEGDSAYHAEIAQRAQATMGKFVDTRNH